MIFQASRPLLFLAVISPLFALRAIFSLSIISPKNNRGQVKNCKITDSVVGKTQQIIK
jgi:hypothetical protein